MRNHLFAALLFSASYAAAQVGAFGGPSVLSQGVGNVGTRSGQDVDLRFFANATGFYDTGLTPLSVRDGQLERPEGLYGVEAGLGAYGQHSFRRSTLGVDYNGNFRHYPSFSRLDGSNQQLQLEYAHQLNQRALLVARGIAGTQTFGTALAALGGPDTGVDGSSLLFDNRTTYVQTNMQLNYALTRRTAVSVGGSGYNVSRESRALVGVRGYTLQGTLSHQIGRRTFIAANYSHMHYDFPRSFGESDINVYTGSWNTQLGRSWELALTGGIFTAAVQGVRDTALDPEIAALLGIGSLRTIFYRETILPSATVRVTKNFRRASWNAHYERSITPGNGVFLTSRRESVGSDFSYTATRRWSFAVNFWKSKLESIGQELQSFQQIWGGANATYRLGGGFNLTAAYGRRNQDLQTNAFVRNSSRVSLSLTYSPGTIPISFH